VTGALLGVRRLGRRALDRLAPPPVLIGHSHARPIFEAAAEAGFRLKGYNFWTAPQPALNPDRTAFHPEIRRTLARGPVFSAVGGVGHNLVGMVRHPRPFDLVLPGEPGLAISPGAELLPSGAVRQAIAAVIEEHLAVMRLVRSVATGRVFHLMPPPPLEDGARMLADIPWMFFPHLTREVAPALVRYKCWRLHGEIVAAFCAREGIEAIPPPPEASDGRGFLKPEHYADAMHVNARYGALVLRQMRQAL
jgi:hypothetical protein